MARVTVEDCVKNVEDRFELLMLAAHRARVLMSGEEALVEKGRDKNDVVALREIAEGVVDVEVLRQEVVQRYRQSAFEDDAEERREDNKTDGPRLDENSDEKIAEVVAMLPQQDGDAAGEADTSEGEPEKAKAEKKAPASEGEPEKAKAEKKAPASEGEPEKAKAEKKASASEKSPAKATKTKAKATETKT